jgi:metallo-beta-lactamase family protein
VRLQFLGADRQVTGSRHFLDAGGIKILIDCGLFQEREFLDRNWAPFPIPPRQIDLIVLTHAHIDHCGLLPRLVREGFRGRVLTTPASVELVELVLRDAAAIQEEDAAYKQKRHRKEGREGKFPELPLFTTKDVDRALPLVEGVAYGRAVRLNGHVRMVFRDAGHILGSACVEIESGNGDGDGHRRLVFSGDLGQWGKPILRDPAMFEQADYVLLESTYGNRDHDRREDVETQLAEAINRTVGRGGNVVIPTFAIERAQELLYHMSRLESEQRIPRVPVYLDSPMAAAATRIFDDHRECYDDEMLSLVDTGQQPLGFSGLKIVRTVEESKAINHLKQPAVIMAPSGMCSAGRIKHHLAHNITRPECEILFCGYQSRGTLGQQILDGCREVRIHGRLWPVRAQISAVHGFSGHADRSALMRWLRGFRAPPRQLFLTHGEAQSSLALAEQVRNELGWQVTVPQYQDAVELA